jgi:hypothetical protein
VPVPPRASPPPPAPSPPASRDVIEFEDEVVEVRRAPEPAPRAQSAAAPASGEPVVKAQQRILQYQKTSGSGGLLGDDLGQLSGGTRSLVYAVVLLVAAGIVYGVIHLVR